MIRSQTWAAKGREQVHAGLTAFRDMHRAGVAPRTKSISSFRAQVDELGADSGRPQSR